MKKSRVEKLIDEDKLLEETYKGRRFYMRKCLTRKNTDDRKT